MGTMWSPGPGDHHDVPGLLLTISVKPIDRRLVTALKASPDKRVVLESSGRSQETST
jgi:hypothetical protein